MPHLAMDPRMGREDATCCSVLELRQYRLHPGERDTLVALFESDFIEPQEALGMHVVGTFTDQDAEDRFVWIRGFSSHPARTKALASFYLGPVWAAKREQANRTMVDSDNVLLLRPCPGLPSIPEFPPIRPAASSGTDSPSGLSLEVHVCFLDHAADESPFVARLAHDVLPALHDSGAAFGSVLRTDHEENGFPRLPVRSDVNAVAVIAGFAEAGDNSRTALGADGATVLSRLNGACVEIQTLRLMPTGRSEIR